MSPKNMPVGQAALVHTLRLQVPAPAVSSVVGPGVRKTNSEGGRTIEKYTSGYMPENTLVGHLRFALRYEPIDLGVLSAAFRTPGAAEEISAWVKSGPTGAYARRAWFLYEWLTGEKLDLPDAGVVTYVEALDKQFHVTAKGIQSRRHKVTDNILGTPGFAPTVRRTALIADYMKQAINLEARELVAGCDPEVLARAVNYLYTKETKSSFAIEHEVASGKRAERFVAALQSAASFDPSDAASLVALQNTIVDPRYAAEGFRDFQNFVGETVGGYREHVHFICPRPVDVGPLMHDWTEMAGRLKGSTDPVVAAALVAFGFVFIHPFEDGNGRIHRFLIHQVLSTEGFTPPDVLFPISAAILRDRRSYDVVLEAFSKGIQEFIEWRWAADKSIEVQNDTDHLYRYFDATRLVEFLYGKAAETVRKDLKEELGFVAVYDGAMIALRDIVDMPDRRASLLVRICMQNSGKLSKSKRTEFKELSDTEIAQIESAIQELLAERNVDEAFASAYAS
jgi:hypothetical protein